MADRTPPSHPEHQRNLLGLATQLCEMSDVDQKRFLAQIDEELSRDLGRLLEVPPDGYLESGPSREVLEAHGLRLGSDYDGGVPEDDSDPDDVSVQDWLFADSEDIALPKSIGRYRILRMLGRGGQGTVFEAIDDRGLNKRHVALKVCAGLFLTTSHLARLEAEYHALSILDHNNIARVHDAGHIQSGHPYFALELISGGSMTDYVKQNDVSQPERLRLFVDVCEGVAHAHQRGILHRDLKPSNVLIQEDSDQAVPKLIDFGIAKSLEQTLVDGELTQSGVALGTRHYASPEQVRGDLKRIDTRSDIYSLGLLLYELLTDQHPLDSSSGRSDTATLENLWEHSPRRPSSLVAKGRVSPELDWVALKCLQVEPGDRYASVRDLIRDLERFLRGEAVFAAPPSLLYRARKWGLRHWRFASVGLLMLLLISALGWTKLSEQDLLRRVYKALVTTLLNPGQPVQSIHSRFDAPTFEKYFRPLSGWSCLEASGNGLLIEQGDAQDLWRFALDQQKWYLAEDFEIELEFDASGVSVSTGAYAIDFVLLSRSGLVAEAAWYNDSSPDGNNTAEISFKVPRGPSKSDATSKFTPFGSKTGRIRMSRRSGEVTIEVRSTGDWRTVERVEGCHDATWLRITGTRWFNEEPQSLSLNWVKITTPEAVRELDELVDNFDEGSESSGFVLDYYGGVPVRLGGRLVVESYREFIGVTSYLIPPSRFQLIDDFDLSLDVMIEDFVAWDPRRASVQGITGPQFDARIGIKLWTVDQKQTHCEFVLLRQGDDWVVRGVPWMLSQETEEELSQGSATLSLRRRGEVIEWLVDGDLLLRAKVTDEPLVMRLYAQTIRGVSASLKFDNLRAKNLGL